MAYQMLIQVKHYILHQNKHLGLVFHITYKYLVIIYIRIYIFIFIYNIYIYIGSIAYICQPLGSILSGWVSEPLGRKKAMILVNIPHIIAWIMFYFASSLAEMYIGAILLGFGVGFMEAPIVTYIGEIWYRI